MKALPTKPTPIVRDFTRYMLLLYGREGVGKTTLMADFPGAFFITTEPGTKGFELFEAECADWGDVLNAVDLLEKDPDRFKIVVIDTVDRAYDMALDYTCERLNIPYPGEDDSGENDWGLSWRKVKQEFMSIVHRLSRLRLGPFFISHAKESRIKTKSGEAYDRTYPTMSGQARSVVEAVVDFIFFADYIRDTSGNDVRVIFTEGSESICAKARKGVGRFPPILPLPFENGHDVLVSGFLGKHPGVDPRTLKMGKQTGAPTGKLVRSLAVGQGRKTKTGITKTKRRKTT